MCENLFINTYLTLKKAYDNNLNNVVILEDDARFVLPMDKNKISHILDWMNKNEWDLFYLGHVSYIPFSILKTKHIVKPLKPVLAHSIIFSKTGIYKVLHAIEYVLLHDRDKIEHVDRFYTTIPGLKKYSVLPSICNQNKRPTLLYKHIKNYNMFFYIVEIISVIIPFTIVILLILKILIICKKIKNKNVL